MPRRTRQPTPDEVSRSLIDDPWSWLELPDPEPTQFASAKVRHSFGSGRRGKPPPEKTTLPARQDEP